MDRAAYEFIDLHCVDRKELFQLNLEILFLVGWEGWRVEVRCQVGAAAACIPWADR